MPESGTEVLLVDVGDVRLAIPVAAVVGVDLDAPAPEVDAHAVLDRTESHVERRRIRVRGRGEFDLSVCSALRVQRVLADDLQPTPPFLAGMFARVGLVGLVRLDGRDGFALYVDPTALEPAS